MGDAVGNVLTSEELSGQLTEGVGWICASEIPRGQDDVEEIVIRVYEHTLNRQAVTILEVATALKVSSCTVERAVQELRNLRLVRYCAEQDGFIAVSPDAAQVELVLPLEAVIHEKKRELAGIHRELDRFAKSFRNHQRARQQGELVVTPRDQQEVSLRLADSIHQCTGEILAMWPVGSYETQLFKDTRALAREAVQRGVELRTLYPHTARSHPSVRALLSQDLDAGAHVRTSAEVSHFVVIVDREVAFVPTNTADSTARTVTAVYEPVMVNLLRGNYQNIWQAGGSFEKNGMARDAALDTVKVRILTMLASGLKDDVIARRVGISSRTLRRHISVIMEELSAESRFQAGVAAARAGLVTTAGG